MDIGGLPCGWSILYRHPSCLGGWGNSHHERFAPTCWGERFEIDEIPIDSDVFGIGECGGITIALHRVLVCVWLAGGRRLQSNSNLNKYAAMTPEVKEARFQKNLAKRENLERVEAEVATEFEPVFRKIKAAIAGETAGSSGAR